MMFFSLLKNEIINLQFGLEKLNSSGVFFSTRDASIMSAKDIDVYHSQIAYLSKKYKIGNCLHKTSIAYDYLKI